MQNCCKQMPVIMSFEKKQIKYDFMCNLIISCCRNCLYVTLHQFWWLFERLSLWIKCLIISSDSVFSSFNKNEKWNKCCDSLISIFMLQCIRMIVCVCVCRHSSWLVLSQYLCTYITRSLFVELIFQWGETLWFEAFKRTDF